MKCNNMYVRQIFNMYARDGKGLLFAVIIANSVTETRHCGESWLNTKHCFKKGNMLNVTAGSQYFTLLNNDIWRVKPNILFKETKIKIDSLNHALGTFMGNCFLWLSAFLSLNLQTEHSTTVFVLFSF